MLTALKTETNVVHPLPDRHRLSSRLRFLARAAGKALRFPIVGISLRSAYPGLDANRFLIGAVDIASDRAMCRETLRGGDVLTVADLTVHPVFQHNALVTDDPFLTAYAGCVIRTSCLTPVGTFCVFDTVPRELSPCDVSLLRGFAETVGELLDAHLLQAAPSRDQVMRDLVAAADLAFSVGDRLEAEHLVHLAYLLSDEPD